MSSVARGQLWAERYPELGTGPLTTESCVSEEYFALERDRVFRRSWLNVGRAEEIPEAGDYFVREIAICSASVLIMRGSNGVVRGFHNVCSHRGNKLMQNERGSCRRAFFRPFHKMRLFQVYRVEERANWKIGLDAQNELSHLPFLHRWTLGDAFATNQASKSRFAIFEKSLTIASAMSEPLLPEPVGELEDQFGGEMPGPVHRLYLMSLSLIEVATPVELSREREGVATCDPLRYFPRF